jgi:hypothetical protein
MTMNQPVETHDLKVAFLPVHKLAFGIATGCAAALLVAVLTVDAIVRDSGEHLPVELLAEYFSGYTVSWPGVFVGAAWAAFCGFVFGWFIAFVRNVVLATQLVIVKTKAHMAENRGFLDHI